MKYNENFILPEIMTMDLEIEFGGVVFKIIEEFMSNTYLVVKKKDYDESKFPLKTYIIPKNN